MKFLFSFAALLCLLQSCTTYYFTTPQPVGGEKLAEIPENLRGTWNCGYDSSGERKCDEEKGYFVTANQIAIKEANKTTTWRVGQEVELLMLDDFYVFNFVEKVQMYNSKGKPLDSPLFSALVLMEGHGMITVWNVDRPWDGKSARKFRKAKRISDKIELDTMSNDQNYLLNLSLNKNALEKISLSRPWAMFGADSTLISGDDIEWDVDYNCGEVMFDDKSSERKYNRLENKKYRLLLKENKIERKQNILFYHDQYSKTFGDAQIGYTLVVSQEPYTDTTRIKRDLFFSDVPMYDVYYLIQFDKDVVPLEFHRNIHIDETKIIPTELAQELIKSSRISYETFRNGGESNEKGFFHWNHLSDEDKEILQQFIEEIEY